MTRHVLITASLLLALAPGAILAQTALAPANPAQTSPSPTDPSIAVTKTATVPTAAELQALAFYVQQKDQPSVTAELRRLRAKFPGWVPPADLTKLSITQPSTEIDTIYRQIAAGQLAEARATIASTQAAYSGWTPAPDMLRLLETAEGQVKLDAALDAGNANEALTIAVNSDTLLRCDRINNAWRIAKAQENQQAATAAVATYTAIIGACSDFPAVVATLEKSDSVTTDAELTAFFDTVRAKFPDRTAELATVQAKLMAGRGANPATITISPDIKPKPRPVEKPAAPKPEVAAKAPEVAANAPTRAASPASSGPGCLAATTGATSAPRLADRGWCAYNLDQPMVALAAFQAAEAKLNGAQKRDARFGMALSYLKMNMTEEASRIAASTQLTQQQRVDTESIILDQRGVLAYKKQQYGKAIGYFNALEQVSGHLRRDLAILRGYAYLNSGNVSNAQLQFQTLNDQLATPESRRGLAAVAGRQD